MQNEQALAGEGPGHDVHYVASLLSGAAPSQSVAHSQPKRKRRYQQHQSQPAAGQSRQLESQPLVALYSKPSSCSTQPNKYFCEACDCWLDANERSWQVHVAGAKHQRQLASLQLTGQLGKAVISVFEANPGTAKL